MPLLSITVNKTLPEPEQQTIVKTFSASVANMLGKPESYVMVIMQTNLAMSFAGSDAPLAYLELKSLGLPEDKTTEFSANLCSLVSEQLNVPQERTYIEFSNPARHMWGWNSLTF